MSRVLVSPPPIPLLASMMESLEPPPSQQQLRLDAMNLPGDMGTASLEEKSMASQLAYLASQHHASEYNRLKFGPGGAPIMYIPLSIQLPIHVRELKARQAQSALKKLWWPADAPGETRSGGHMDVELSQNRVQDSKFEPPQCENFAQCTQAVRVAKPEVDNPAPHLRKHVPPLNHPPALNLQRELSVAMSSPLSIITIRQLSPQVAFQQPNLNLHTKTSESHPINISPIIPIELLPLISSHLTLAPRHTPYMFELPPSLLLHRLAMQPLSPSSDTTRSSPLMHIPDRSHVASMNSTDHLAFYPGSSFAPSDHSSNRMPEHAARGVDEHGLKSSTASQTFGKDPGITIPGDNPSPHPQNCSDEKAVSSKLSLVLPFPQNRPHSAPPSFLSSHAILPEVAAGVVTVPQPLPELVHAISSDIPSNDVNGRDLARAAPSLPVVLAVSPPAACAVSVPHPRVLLGNMLLSSCPGKKVRLSGPVKGRGAICRDLDHDLRRVKALGVGCIICCLDDEELAFLGASWSQYSEIARAVGLDILRMPIPEGLVPPTPALLDQHLSHIIQSYTLKGVPVLVHCRGGVGRAGLVACCWMLKLGLCGWLSRMPGEFNGHVIPEHGIAVAKVRRETVELVERIIAVVRRRRSVKAIETYEQVHFLVEFVEYLEGGSRRDT